MFSLCQAQPLQFCSEVRTKAMLSAAIVVLLAELPFWSRLFLEAQACQSLFRLDSRASIEFGCLLGYARNKS